MTSFILRKDQRFKGSLPVQYRGKGVFGEGILKDLSLNGASITGEVPVSVGLTLGLTLTIPGDPEPLSIEHAVVHWVKGMEFGIELVPKGDVAVRITKIITDKVKESHHY